MKAWIQKLLTSGFKFDNDVRLNEGRYFIKMDNANKMFPFENHDPENFPGVDMISKEIDIVDTSIGKSFRGRVIFTYHEDLNRWTSSIHFDDKDLNQVSMLTSIEVAAR